MNLIYGELLVKKPVNPLVQKRIIMQASRYKSIHIQNHIVIKQARSQNIKRTYTKKKYTKQNGHIDFLEAYLRAYKARNFVNPFYKQNEQLYIFFNFAGDPVFNPIGACRQKKTKFNSTFPVSKQSKYPYALTRATR